MEAPGRIGTLALLALTCHGLQATPLSLKQVAYIGRGLRETEGRVVVYRPSPDNVPLLVFCGDIPNTWSGVYFYRYRPWDRYSLAKVDTGNMGSGLIPGNMIPWVAADLDRDSLPEVLAKNSDYTPTKTYFLAALYGHPTGSLCPDSLEWSYRCDSNVVYGSEPFMAADLDLDGRTDFLVHVSVHHRVYIFENVGPDSFRLVWSDSLGDAYAFASGDFDGDGRVEFATAGIALGWVKVFKCTGDDHYVLWDSVEVPQPYGSNGHDVFAAGNLDGSHRAVLFVAFARYSVCRTYLYMLEPTRGTDGYAAFLVDSADFRGYRDARSCCADVDGDGIEELLWSCGTQVQAYRQTGLRHFERVWYWFNQESTSANLSAYDVNGNGYNELVISGSGRTFIFETEAVRVLNPDRTRELEAGDTCEVRWRIFTPPRCDSVSLFLKTDTVVREGERFWRLDTIATGLAPTESSYTWVVPDTVLAWAKVLAIAYGPGWQYDESDSAFSIGPHGVSEAAAAAAWQLPAQTVWHGVIRMPEPRPGQAMPAVMLCDALGRRIAVLRSGINDLRHLSPGVYFVRMAGGAGRMANAKVVIAK